MADIRINQLPTAASPVPSLNVAVDGTATEKVTIQTLVDTGRPLASQAEAEAGVNPSKAMTPLTTKQAIAGQVSDAGISGNYDDLSNLPTLGTAAAQDSTAFATAAQGATADSAVQPGDLGTAAAEDVGFFASAAQGTNADNALQPAAIGSTVQAYSANLDELSTVNPGVSGLSILGDATVDDVYNTLTTAVWDSGRTETMVSRSKRICHIADFCAPSSSVDRTSELLAWATEGQAAGVKLILGSDGLGSDTADYITEEEIEIIKPGQVIEFEQTGGMGYGEDIGELWIPRIRLRATGGVSGWFNTTGKRVRSRRLFRGSAADPQDAPLSAVLNIQAEGVHIIRPSIWLDCDYTDPSPSNLGDYCDIGIFVGCRVGVHIRDPQIIGYFRNSGIGYDVTYDNEAPRHLDKAGNPYPPGVLVNGADGNGLWNPYIRGARKGVAVMGALPKVGATAYGDPYYDQQLGTTIADSRGSFGFSDFNVYGGWIYGPDHHSNRRLADPTPSGGVLNQTSLQAESDNMPAAVHIDGLAGNASGSIWGMNFFGTRIATFEAFRARLGYASRVRVWGGHIEGRNSGLVMNTAGALIDTNNYTLNTYGDISGTNRTVNTSWYGSVRQLVVGDAGAHFYGTGFRLDTDSGRLFVPGYIGANSGALDLRGAGTSGVLMRAGASSVALADLTGFSVLGTIAVDAAHGLRFPVYAAADIASAAHAVNTANKVQGKAVWDVTNFRIMVAAGGSATSSWRVADNSATVTPT